MFSFSDFFNYLTSSDSDGFALKSLLSLPESHIYHFTASGDILELSFTDARFREYVLSGFSLVRRGNSIHWFIVAGELLSEEQWRLRSLDSMSIDLENVSASKRAFLSKLVEDRGGTSGTPLLLEGTETAVKTILAGEIDARTGRHVGRSIFVESENAYSVFCDDPEVLCTVSNSVDKNKLMDDLIERLEEAAALFSIVEGLLQLPTYFGSRVTIGRDIVGSKSVPRGLKGRGGQGINSKFSVVESVSVTVGSDAPTIRKITLPQYSIETEGHWRRLSYNESGKDREGNSILGKTWVNRSNPWRAMQGRDNIIYVKDSLAVAKERVFELYRKVEKLKVLNETGTEQGMGNLYVLRCTLMKEEVYKVGWTSGNVEDRAKELSSATGVPLAFVVVESWSHIKAEALETEVHAILSPYRLNTQREFFQLEFRAMKRIIEQTIERLKTAESHA